MKNEKLSPWQVVERELVRFKQQTLPKNFLLTLFFVLACSAMLLLKIAGALPADSNWIRQRIGDQFIEVCIVESLFIIAFFSYRFFALRDKMKSLLAQLQTKVFFNTMMGITAVVTEEEFFRNQQARPDANVVACENYILTSPKEVLGQAPTGQAHDITSQLKEWGVILEWRGDLFVPGASDGLMSFEAQKAWVKILPAHEFSYSTVFK